MNISSNSNSKMNVIVEIKNSGFKRIERIMLDANSESIIGRGWDSQVIINDKYIDPEHLAISTNDDGAIFITDLKTKNGSRLGRFALSDMTQYEGNKPIRLGDTEVRLFKAGDNVVPALDLDFSHLISQKFGSFYSIIFITLATALVLFASSFFYEGQELTMENVLDTSIGFGVLALGWSLFGGFVGKIFRHETNFTLHWILLCFITIMTTMLWFFKDIFSFNINSLFANTTIEQIFITSLIVIFVYGSLSFSTRIRKRKKLIIAILFGVLPLLLTTIEPLMKEERNLWTDQALSQGVTMLPAFQWVESTTYEKHVENLNDVFDELDEEVKP